VFLESIDSQVFMKSQSDSLGKIKEGLELFRRRNFRDAEVAFRSAVEFDPDSFYALFHLGRTLIYLDKFEDAKNMFRRALEVNLQLANSWLQSGRFCSESTGYEADESCLTGYLFEHERDEDIRKMLAKIFYEIRPNVLKEHCFEEKAVKTANPEDNENTNRTILERRNCHVTTH